MRYRLGVAGFALLLATVTGGAPERDPTYAPPTNPALLSTIREAHPEPRTADLGVGQPAPMFSYLSTDGRWHKFSDLLDERPVLLVFGARSTELAALENARTVFDDMGVDVAVALDMRAGSAATLAKELELQGPIISDPKRAIASLYHSLMERSLRHAPSYFVVDTKRTIRALGYGSVPSPPQLIVISARGLGKPLPESAWKMSNAHP